MYINPFWGGVAATVLVEFILAVCIIIYTCCRINTINREDDYEEDSDETT